MTIFELVKLALDELYQKGVKKHGDKIDGLVKQQMLYLSTNYSSLTSNGRVPIAYSDIQTRLAYVYKYVTAHGDYVVQILEKLRSYNGDTLFDGPKLRVSCVGGGPGSDVIGVLKFLTDYEGQSITRMTGYLLDSEQAWADTWTEIAESLEAETNVNLNYQLLDVTKPASWEAQEKFLEAHLFTLSFFVSEVYSLDHGIVATFWRHPFDESMVGARFLYLDNGSDVFNDYFDKQWNQRSDIKLLISETNVTMTPRTSEQKSELDFYRAKFGQFARLQGKVSYSVLEKISA